MKLKYCIASLFFLSIGFNVLAGGGWPQQKGRGFFKLSHFLISAQNIFNNDGTTSEINTTVFNSTGFYAEYGLTNKLTVIVNAPFWVNNAIGRQEYPDGTLIAEEESFSSFGDLDLGVKLGLYSKNGLSVAGTLIFGIPSGKTGGGPSKLLQTGDGEFNQLVQIDAGKSFGKMYANASLGYNHRAVNFSDEIRWSIEGGIAVKKFYFILRVVAVHSLFNSDEDSQEPSGVFSNNVEYISWSPEVNFNLTKHLGFSASMGGAFMAKRLLAAPSYTFGAYWVL